MTRSRWMLFVVLALALNLTACGGGDSPTDPGPDPGGFEDTPAIPRPTSPGGDVPAESSVLTRISNAPLQNYAPRLSNVVSPLAKVQLRARDTCSWFDRATGTAVAVGSWNPSLAYNQITCGYLFAANPTPASVRPFGHPVLLQDGAWKGSITHTIRTGVVAYGLPPFPAGWARMIVETPDPPAEAPYLRRDRFWRLKPIEGGVGDYLLLTGPVQGAVSTSYTAGVSTTETESFGRSVTASVGLDLGPLSASVSGTLSESFSTSVTISSETTQTFTKSVSGEAGKTIQFMVWELVEVYSITDAEGEPYVAEGYAFVDERLERKAVALALEATSFPAD